MRLKQFDLNLLVVLDALLTDQNTTRAGQRIKLSQPAVSLALARLRDYFKDDLLTQVGRNLVPTPLGLSLAKPVRELLMQAEATLQSRPMFDPATAERKFTLMMSDYVSVVLMAELARQVERIAPRIEFDVLPHSLSPWESVESGQVDLLVMPEHFLGHANPTELLFVDHYVCVVWKENPAIGEEISREQYLSLGHVLARPGAHPQREPALDESFFAQFGITRRIEVIVAEFAAIPHYVLNSSRIATMHSKLAHQYARLLPLKVLPMPFEMEELRESMLWHHHRNQDLGLTWLRTMLKQVAANL